MIGCAIRNENEDRDFRGLRPRLEEEASAESWNRWSLKTPSPARVALMASSNPDAQVRAHSSLTYWGQILMTEETVHAGN